MKKFQINLAVIAALAVGIFIGYRLEFKINQKVANQKNQNNQISSPQAPEQLSTVQNINFRLRKQNFGGVMVDEQSMRSIENLLNSKNIKFFFQIEGESVPAESRTDFPKKINAGMLDASRVLDMIKKGKPYIPLYYASPNPTFSECYSETQIISNSVQSVRELTGKKIGTESIAIPLAYLTFKKLKEKNITVSKLQVYKNALDGAKDLNSKKIDAFVDKIIVYPDGTISSKLGNMVNGSFVQYPDFKILSTSNDKVPCKVIFLSSKLTPETKAEFESRLLELTTKAEYKDTLFNATTIATLRKVTPQSWKTVEELFKSINDFSINSFANEVVTSE